MYSPTQNYAYPAPSRPMHLNSPPMNQASSSSGPYGNMTPSSLQPAFSGSMSSIRVKIADEYRIDPPIPPTAGLTSTSTSQPVPFELDLERKLLQNGESPNLDNIVQAVVDAKPGSLDTLMSQLMELGCEKSIAALAVAYGQLARIGQDVAALQTFTTNYQQLIGMGFSPAMALGALRMTRNELNAATDACLGAE